MTVTLKEVAGKAGVSVTTVSRILHNDPNLSVSPQTRERVLKAASDLSYQVRKPAHQANKRLAIMQWYHHDQELTDLYYLNLRLQIEQAAQAAGWETMTAFANNWETVLPDVENVIAIGKYSRAQLEKMQQRFANIVVVDDDCLELGLDCVLPDLAGGIRQAVHYLQRHYAEIGMIAGQEETTDGRLVDDRRLSAFQAAVDPSQAENYVYGDYQSVGGYQAMKSLLSQHPGLSAVIVANDVMAIGALHWLNDQGVQVPQQLALISCNNTAAAQYAYPALSAIDLPTGQMTEEALRLLHERQVNPTVAAKRLVLATKLVCRQSTVNE